MAFGILEPKPGHDHGLAQATHGSIQLEETLGNGQNVTIPVPTTGSPRDPLNMSPMRKELYFRVLILGACVTGVLGPVIVPGFSIVAAAFEIPLSKVTLLNGSLVMALGVSAYLCAPLSTIIGRRLAYLLTTLVLTVGCIWAGFAQTYGSLLASRIVQGLGMGPFFSLAGTASINDVFLVHERGRRAGLWNLAVLVSVNIAPVISGYVITALSWRWAFYITAIAFAFTACMVVVFVPETLFDRSGEVVEGISVAARATAARSSTDDEHDKEKITLGAADSKPVTAICEPMHQRQQPSMAHGKLRKMLGLEGVPLKAPSRLLPMLIKPFFLIRHPIVIWASLAWSVVFSWAILLGAVADQIFTAPPYSLSTTAVGVLVGVPPLIGSVLGTLIGGWVCDFAAKAMSIRNKGGLYEPEFRLVVLAPGLITLGIGGFGIGIAIEKGLSIWACAVFLAFLNVGMGLALTGIVAYTNDACQEKAGEAFGVALLIKSAYAFGLSFAFNDYYTSHGPNVFFSTWAGLTVAVLLSTIPVYIFGKRIRLWARASGVLDD